MSWESTALYYKSINEGIKARRGGLHSAKIILYSVDFAELAELQHNNDWQKITNLLVNGAKSIAASGADCLLICTNTMHKVASEIEAAIQIPLLHISDATAEQLIKNKLTTVGLLGTKFTMEQDFYKDRFKEKFGITALIPDSSQRDQLHNIIYNELCLGKIIPESKEHLFKIINSLQKKGAQAIVLGCTEITMLIAQSDIALPLYDTTAFHSAKAVSWALN